MNFDSDSDNLLVDISEFCKRQIEKPIYCEPVKLPEKPDYGSLVSTHTYTPSSISGTSTSTTTTI